MAGVSAAWHSFDTPVGRMHVAATGKGLCRVTWRMEGPDEFEEELVLRFPGRPIVHDPAALEEVEREISEYFTGRRTSFDLSIDLMSLGDFERRVLEATQHVPYGSTVSYSQIAERIGRPRAARAVGNALRNNPVPLVVPCHRIVRADGSPGGYGGPHGTREKERLLHLESRA